MKSRRIALVLAGSILVTCVAPPLPALNEAPRFEYATKDGRYSAGEQIAPNEVIANEEVYMGSFFAEPELPEGLKLNASSGTISGTPTAASSKVLYEIAASNEHGTGTATISIQVLPQTPRSLSGTPSPDEISLQWKKSVGGERYNIYRSDSGDDQFELLHTLTDSVLVDTAVETGIAYSYFVRAIHSTADTSFPSDTIEVLVPSGRLPIAVSDQYGVSQGDTLVISGSNGVLSNDSLWGASISCGEITGPTSGTLDLQKDGGFTYTPDSSFSGTDSFAYAIYNSGGNPVDTGKVALVVTSNECEFPLAFHDGFAGNEDDTIRVTAPGVLANDSTSVECPVELAIVTESRFGKATVNDDGSLLYVPDENFWGIDTLVYSVGLVGAKWNSTAQVIITIESVNDTPVLSGLQGQVVVSGSGFSTIWLSDAVWDPDQLDSTLTWSFHGANNVRVNANWEKAELTYPSGWVGSDTVVFKVSDSLGAYDSTSLVFTVTGSSDGTPVVSSISDRVVTENEMFDEILLDEYVSDPDTPDSLLSWTFSYKNQAPLTVSIDSLRAVTATVSDSEWSGSRSVVFRASDPQGHLDSALVTFTVVPVNDTPQVLDIPDQANLSGQAFDTIYLDNFVYDPDDDKESLVWWAEGVQSLSVFLDSTLRRAVVSKPDGWVGSETVIFGVSDSSGAFSTDSASFSISDPGSDAPVLSHIADQTIMEGQSFSAINLDSLVEDSGTHDSDLVWNISGMSNLTVDVSSDRVVSVSVTNENWTGSEGITFKVSDADGNTVSDAVMFTVVNVNDPPIVDDLPQQVINEGAIFQNVSLDEIVSDVDNLDEELTWSIIRASALTATISSTRMLQIGVPDVNWYGADTVLVAVQDPGGLFDTTEIAFRVLPINDEPIISTIPGETIQEGDFFSTIYLDEYVDDVDDADDQLDWTASVSKLSGAAGAPTVSISSDRVLSIQIPSDDWYGQFEVLFLVEDPSGASGATKTTFTVAALNDAPRVSPIPGQSISEGQTFSSVSLNTYASDPETDVTELAWTAQVVGVNALSANSESPTVTVQSATASIALPEENWCGTFAIVFTATDPQGADSSVQSNFSVTCQNDCPMLSNMPDQVFTSNPIQLDLNSYLTELDGDAVSWTATSDTSDVTVQVTGNTASVAHISGWAGVAAITFRADDGTCQSDAVTANFYSDDQVAPVFVLQSPDTALLQETSTATVKILVSDASGLAEVRIDGTVVTGTEGVYQKDVGLTAGTNYIQVEATDASLNANVATMVVPIVSTNTTSWQYSDDFQDGTLDWVDHYGTWTEASGKLSLAPSSGGGRCMHPGNLNVGNFLMQTDIAVGSSSDAGVAFRVSRSEQDVHSFEGLYVGFYVGGDYLTFGWMSTTQWYPLVGGNVDLEPNTPYRLSISMWGDDVRVFVDGALIIQAIDTHYPTGNIGFRAWNASADYDNFQLYHP